MINTHLLSSLARVFIICLFVNSLNVVYSQTPGTLYGSTGNTSNFLITIDPVTGTGTVIDSIYGTNGAVTEIEFREDGVLFGTTGGGNAEVVTIDPLTGISTLIGTHPFGAVNGLEFDNGGVLYGAFYNVNGGSTDLVTVDQATGALT